MTKKLNCIIITLFLVSFTFQAQEDNQTSATTNFGVKAGYSTLIFKVSVDGESLSTDASGFYLGGFAELVLSDTFYIQPELNYTIYFEDGENSSVLNIPVLAKFYVDEKFGIFAGPQLDYLLNEDDAEGFKRLGVGITAGVAVEITEDLFADVRYAFGLTDRIDTELPELEEFDVNTRFNYLLVGLGFRF